MFSEGKEDRRGRGGGWRMKQRKKDKYINEKMCKHNIEEMRGVEWGGGRVGGTA